MATLRGGNFLKGAALVLLIVGVGAALLLIPATREEPDTTSLVNVPSMTNVPPAGALHIETKPEQE